MSGIFWWEEKKKVKNELKPFNILTRYYGRHLNPTSILDISVPIFEFTFFTATFCKLKSLLLEVPGKKFFIIFLDGGGPQPTTCNFGRP